MADEFIRFRYHVRPPTGPTNPLIQPGELAYFPTSAIPAGWLKADGSYYSPTDQPALFRAIGYRHGRDGSGRFRILEVTDIIEQVNPHNGDPVFNIGGSAVRSHGHPGGQLASGGGHTHGVTVIQWYDLPYNIIYDVDPGIGDAGADNGIQYYPNTNHSHSVTASGGGGVETVPNHVILVLCVCAFGDVLETIA
jgi:hypothetical protein